MVGGYREGGCLPGFYHMLFQHPHLQIAEAEWSPHLNNYLLAVEDGTRCLGPTSKSPSCNTIISNPELGPEVPYHNLQVVVEVRKISVEDTLPLKVLVLIMHVNCEKACLTDAHPLDVLRLLFRLQSRRELW